MRQEGIIIVISAPSGAGKTTLCRELIKKCPDIKESVSYTTRSPREGEIDGLDYFFVSRDEFGAMIGNNAFAEWAEVHGNLYGTALDTLDEARRKGYDIILDIDCQGAMKLKEYFEGGIYIFILPPSMDELRRRLENRSSDSREVIERRIERAKDEIKEAKWYDYIIINDNIDAAFDELSAIILAQRRKTSRMLEKIVKLFEI